jgi:NADP-dependent 3-hydroxy acid dehydrogenase YdfG
VLTAWAKPESRLFAAEGAKVVVADILGNDAEVVAGDIRACGGEAIAAEIDVTSEAEWGGLIAKTVAAYGRLDILAYGALSLASDEASFVIGTELVIDGGFIAQ